MNRFSLTTKVGAFVLVGLVLLAVLLINFSKVTSHFTSTYRLKLKTTNVGGVIPGARVLMSGVPIGTVQNLELDAGTNTVTIHLQIMAEYPVYSDSRFLIESAGFLGDQYVMIVRGPDRLPPLVDGNVVYCEEPFNLQETARAAAGFLARIDETARRLNVAIARVDEMVLNEQTLSNLSLTVANLKTVSERAMTSMERIDALLATNTPTINGAVTNFMAFSESLNRLADDLRGVIATNQIDFSAAVKNIESASMVMKDLVTDVRSGKGLAGSLVHDETLRENMGALMSNLTTLSSNLNRYGLLYKPKAARPAPAKTIYPGRDPRR